MGRRSQAQRVGISPDRQIHPTMIVMSRLVNWVDRAACAGKDPELFVPEADNRRWIAAALEVCRTCPVIEECRQAGEREWFGVWGGRFLG